MTPDALLDRDATELKARLSLRARLSHRLSRHVPTAPALPHLHGPMVSITFDDVPDTACSTGAALLDAHGAKGTFYVSRTLLGTATEHWRVAGVEALADIHRRGHEIGCHTHDHSLVPTLDAGDFAADIGRNRDAFAALVPGLTLENFAFPYGYASLAAKRVLSRTYGSGRSIVPGLNTGRIDRYFLRANPLFDRCLDAGLLARLMDEAVARNGWVVFFGHDVAEGASPYGCSPGLLEATLSAAGRRGIPVVSIAEGMARARGIAGERCPIEEASRQSSETSVRLAEGGPRDP
ncbi:polysaccharide deacetylase family protein [Methylobacterium sp. 10]|uniref:polysaccharide deacetylase family protein n=1 Tax=Methylobacterium sp. 10 TaxID=1101191 RepID=UPI00048709A3|nr:polysaccharide deacetylase family protein [Methylobacterium sp. 10]